jgi:Cu-Zn family superoxide dismutase
MLKPATAAVALFAVPVLALSACSPNQNPSNEKGTPPPVWTGSPSPGAPAASSSATSAAAQAKTQLTADLKTTDGKTIAKATIDFSSGFAKITVETTASDSTILTPGFHGMHIHEVRKCEGDFTSAKGHFQRPGHTDQHPASGDLTSLQVRDDGSAMVVTTTNAFTYDDLVAGQGTSIIIHEKMDNFANIPDKKYAQINGGTPGPDQETIATGDAGKRIACGEINGQ